MNPGAQGSKTGFWMVLIVLFGGLLLLLGYLFRFPW